MNTQTKLDQEKSNAFAEQMLKNLNGAAISLMSSIAHRTGLFDVMADLPPSSSEAIAKAANLNERYVREALNAFVTGGVVEYDPEKKTYFLPPEHAAFLTRKASPNNIAVTTQWISVLGSVEDDLVECFKKGGGVPYERYHRFHEVMAEESRQTVVLPLLDHLIPLVPGLKEKLEKGIEVLDAGCGSGLALLHLAEHFPNSRFTGYDMSPEAIQQAQQKSKERGLNNIRFEVHDLAKLDDVKKFDWITTFDVVHDQAAPQKVLENLRRALKNDGVYLMQDIAGSSHVHQDKEHPIGPLLYAISCMHCMSVSLQQNGAGLGAMWGKKTATNMLHTAGFTKVDVRQLEHDFINYYYVVRK